MGTLAKRPEPTERGCYVAELDEKDEGVTVYHLEPGKIWSLGHFVCRCAKHHWWEGGEKPATCDYCGRPLTLPQPESALFSVEEPQPWPVVLHESADER